MNNYEYLIHLLYCAVHDTVPLEKPEGVSFEGVLALGKAHEVANLAFLSLDKLQNKPEPSVYQEWQLSYFFAVQRDARQQLAYEQVTQALHEKGIRTLEAQGTVTKTLYPSPELRMMSDIDFIVDEENFSAVEELMQGLGYTTWLVQPGELNAEAEDIEIEFHAEFFSKDIYGQREQYYDAVNHPFSHAAPSAEKPLKWVLEDTYFYLYSLLHTIKHFEVMGCGIRRILDLFYLKKAYVETADTALIERVLQEHGFTKSFRVLTVLEEKWFENTPPRIDITEAEEDVIRSGNHGTREIFLRNNVREDMQKGVRFAKFRHIWAFIFPSKQYIYAMYPVCAERGYSLITARLYRIFKKLTGGLKLSHTKEHIKTILRSDRHITEKGETKE